jgi:hypothetical protein
MAALSIVCAAAMVVALALSVMTSLVLPHDGARHGHAWAALQRLYLRLRGCSELSEHHHTIPSHRDASCCAQMVKTGRPKCDAVIQAVDYVVLAGKKPREAWELAGKPGGEAGIQNIRKQARARLLGLAAPESDAPLGTPSGGTVTSAPPATAATCTGPKNNERVPYRRSSKQVDKQHAADELLKRQYIDAMKLASLELKEAQMDAEREARLQESRWLFNITRGFRKTQSNSRPTPSAIM